MEAGGMCPKFYGIRHYIILTTAASAVTQPCAK